MFDQPNETAKGFSDFASRFVKPENYRGSVLAAIDTNILTNLFYGFYAGARTGVFGGLDDEALLGTTFWQVYTRTNAFRETFGSQFPSTTELIVSNNGDGQYVLIVLDPNYTNVKPNVYEVFVTNEEDIDVAIYGWMRNYLRTSTEGVERIKLFDRYNFLSKEKLYRDLKSFVYQVTNNQKFQIIHTRTPVVQRIQSLHSNVCLGVRCVTDNENNSTAGIIAQNTRGQRGITVAYHAIADPTETTVFVDNHKCEIISKDAISDSCFVVPENDQIFHNCSLTKGPLIGKTPRGYQVAEFNGLKSGKRKTIIDSWSKDLPFVRPYNQLKVYTKDKASPGDSGSALIDDENNVVGFAFFISGFDAPVDFTAWIWAESVFQAHNLKY